MCAVVTGGGLEWTGAEASIFTVLAVAFERYFAVVHPYGNRGKLTFRKVKVYFFEIRCYEGRKVHKKYPCPLVVSDGHKLLCVTLSFNSQPSKQASLRGLRKKDQVICDVTAGTWGKKF